MKRSKTIIIAEAGVNHNGSLELAKKLIDVAYDSGADFVKFQTFKSESLVTGVAELANYQKDSCNELNQLSMLKNLELSKAELNEIYTHCNHVGIKFLSTPFDIDSLKILDQYDMEYIKIASGEITNYPLLLEISKRNKPIICSTGMSTIEEINETLSVLTANGISKEIVTIMQCNTQYPSPFKDVNLNAMKSMRSELGTKVGYSDHTIGIEASLAAVAMGASIIEKHFTIDNNLPGPDQKASLNPSQLNDLIKCIRNIEESFGERFKVPTLSEINNLEVVRKSIVAKIDIKKGEVFTSNNLTTKRPGTGISPMNWRNVIGKKSPIFYKKDDIIN